MSAISNTEEIKQRSFSPIPKGPLMNYETEKVNEFVSKFNNMDQLQKTNSLTFLHGMVQRSLEAYINGTQNQEVSVTYSYPARGHPNDGNPALMSILELMPEKKLLIKENEYTKEQAIWLCEDYIVSWNPKNYHTILSSAYEQISSVIYVLLYTIFL